MILVHCLQGIVRYRNGVMRTVKKFLKKVAYDTYRKKLIAWLAQEQSVTATSAGFSCERPYEGLSLSEINFFKEPVCCLTLLVTKLAASVLNQ